MKENLDKVRIKVNEYRPDAAKIQSHVVLDDTLALKLSNKLDVIMHSLDFDSQPSFARLSKNFRCAWRSGLDFQKASHFIMFKLGSMCRLLRKKALRFFLKC